MNDDLTDLITQLKRAADGDSVEEEYVSRVAWHTSDVLLNRLATTSWLRLKNFIDDDDIRSREPAYDRQMKNEMKWRAEELVELANGKDPHNRRKSFWWSLKKLFRR